MSRSSDITTHPYAGVSTMLSSSATQVTPTKARISHYPTTPNGNPIAAPRSGPRWRSKHCLPRLDFGSGVGAGAALLPSPIALAGSRRFAA